MAQKIKKKGKLNNTEFNNIRFSNTGTVGTSHTQNNNPIPINDLAKSHRMKTIKEVNEYDYATYNTVSPPKKKTISPPVIKTNVSIKSPIMDEFILNLPDDEEEVRDIPKPMSSNIEMKINDIKMAKNLKVNNTKNRYISDLDAERLVDEILDYKNK
jgi:hypothetical protein